MSGGLKEHLEELEARALAAESALAECRAKLAQTEASFKLDSDGHMMLFDAIRDALFDGVYVSHERMAAAVFAVKAERDAAREALARAESANRDERGAWSQAWAILTGSDEQGAHTSEEIVAAVKRALAAAEKHKAEAGRLREVLENIRPGLNELGDRDGKDGAFARELLRDVVVALSAPDRAEGDAKRREALANAHEWLRKIQREARYQLSRPLNPEQMRLSLLANLDAAGAALDALGSTDAGKLEP